MNLPLGMRLTIVLVAFERLLRIFSLGVRLEAVEAFCECWEALFVENSMKTMFQKETSMVDI